MAGLIKKFIQDTDFMILWIELLLFSALYGVAFHSWIIFGLIFLGASWLLSRTHGTVYVILAMSFLWGFIAFSIGHSISWGWATALGMTFFLLGMGAHLTGLKKPMSSTVVPVNQNNFEWLRNGYEGRQNLN